MPQRHSTNSRSFQWRSLFVILILSLFLVGVFSNVAMAAPPKDDPPATPVPTDQAGGQPGIKAPIPAGQFKDLPSGTDDHFSAEELAELKKITAGGISPDDMALIKAFAAQKIRDYVPLATQKLEEKSTRTSETRLVWVAVVIVVGIPLLAFIGFMLYPLITKKKIQKRVPNVTLGKLYRIYLPQALLVTLILLVLGSALWGIQLLNGRILGGITNPQMVLQRESLNHLSNASDALVDDYEEIMLGLAYNLDTTDPEKALFDVVMENALQLKEDPAVQFASSVVEFVMPFISYISLVTFCIILLLFLLRIRPDVTTLLSYPVDILEAEYNGRPLPNFPSVASGEIKSGATTKETMQIIGKKLMWTEMKVISAFAVAVLVAATLMSFGLTFFFVPIAGMLVDSFNGSVEHFLTSENASQDIVFLTILTMVFVVECVVLLLVAFILTLVRVQDAMRQRFAGRITWTQTRSFITKVMLRFLWLMLLAAILGAGMALAAEKLVDLAMGDGKNPNWTLILYAIPLTLVVGINLGFWLFRGFKTMATLLKNSASKEFNLPKPTPRKKAEPPIAVG